MWKNIECIYLTSLMYSISLSNVQLNTNRFMQKHWHFPIRQPKSIWCCLIFIWSSMALLAEAIIFLPTFGVPSACLPLRTYNCFYMQTIVNTNILRLIKCLKFQILVEWRYCSFDYFVFHFFFFFHSKSNIRDCNFCYFVLLNSNGEPLDERLALI